MKLLSSLFLVCFIAGILLGVRLMFFGAERPRVGHGVAALRRWEPAVIAWLGMFGLSGYVVLQKTRVSSWQALVIASVLAVVWSGIITTLAIATSRVRPEVDPNDPRFALQGHVALVTRAIGSNGDGVIQYEDQGVCRTAPARNVDTGSIDAGVEVCIERFHEGVALVERWSQVESRL